MKTQSESRQRLTLWPEKLLGPRPGLKEINLFCWGIFGLCIVIPACYFAVVQIATGKYFHQGSSVDFVYFYGVGEIANTHGATAVYDAQLQLATFNRIVPLNEGTYGPSPYPPFVAQFFRVFALLPFAQAFFLWVVITLVLYIVGITMLLREFFPGRPLERSLLLCFALAYFPFFRNTLVNGQLSAVALFAVAAAICMERRGHLFLSGLALSILLYKPPLLIFILPMLVLTRRFQALWGWLAGAAGLVAISSAIGGTGIWPAYLRFTRSFGHASGVYGTTMIETQKYVDLSALSYAIPGGRTRIALMVLGIVCLAAVVWLFSVLMKPESRRTGSSDTALVWSAVIAWTMVVNIYCPIYDSVLLVIVVPAVLAALRDLQCTRAFDSVVRLAMITFAISWISEALAKRYGVQLLTFAILAFAIVATSLLQKTGNHATAKEPALAR